MLLPKYTPKEQAYPPYPAVSDKTLSATGLRLNASGLPTAGLSDQILTQGGDRIRALLCVGGNPVLAWPDQAKTEKAMEALDLLVVFDFKVTATAELADYVIPPPLTLEIPGHTQMVEWLKYIGVTRGMSLPWAQYTPAIVAPPEGSDLMDEGEFLFRVAQNLGLQLDLVFASGSGPHIEAPPRTAQLDMHGEPPSVDELLEMGSEGSRVSLEDVKLHPHGKLYDIDVQVAEADPENDARLQVGDAMMMGELSEIFTSYRLDPREDGKMVLLCRRVNSFMNSVGQGLPSLGRVENPFCVNPVDLAALSLNLGQAVRVSSAHGSVEGVIAVDPTLRPGTISLTHGFGGRMGDNGRNDPGTSVAQLIGLDEADPVTGIPRMTGLPVTVECVA